MKKRKQRAAALALAVLTAATMSVQPVAAQGTDAADASSGGVREGLWLTEIFPNDYDTANNDAYGTTDDRMEFVELTNTTGRDISLNKEYELLYGSSAANAEVDPVLPLDGSSDVTIKAGETAVIWNCRETLEKNATVEDFRANYLISDDVTIFMTHHDSGWANSGYFALRQTSDAAVVSSYTYVNGTIGKNDGGDICDGLGADLGIPDIGSDMIATGKKSFANPGFVYGDQLGGNSYAPDDLMPDGLYVTEVHPNDANRDAQFGSGKNDMMEFVEITNTTSQDIDFNESYQFYYFYKTNKKQLVVATCADAKKLAADKLTSEDLIDKSGITIPAGKSAVLWVYRENQTTYETFPTEEDFRAAYEIPDDVPVYALCGQNGLGNTDRGVAVTRINEDDDTVMQSYYYWNGVTDLKDKKSGELKISAEGPRMGLYKAAQNPSAGTVAAGQISFPEDDESSPTLTLSTDPYDADAIAVLETGLAEGENLHIPYSYAGTSALPVTYAELFYKTDTMESYAASETTSFAIYNKWYAFVENGYLAGANYVDYYVKFHNAYRTTQTEVRRVDILNKGADQTGIRVSFDGKDVTENAYSGSVYVTAKDFGGLTPSITLDGKAVSTENTLERGTYFVFDHTGVGGYFKNALTTGGDTEETGIIIDTFSKCSTLPADGRLAIPVGAQYFTYEADGSVKITLTLRAATYGSCWEAYTSENNDDFTVSNLMLVLADGTQIMPDTCTGENITTGEDVTLNATDTIKVGDSANQYINVETTFTIPADKADTAAQSFLLDTTTLSDGTHTLTASSALNSKTVSFTVNNSEPVEEEEEQMDLSVSLTLDESGSGVAAQVEGNQDASSVTLYRADVIDGVTILEGAGDSTYSAEEKTDKTGVTTSSNGQYPYQILEIPVTGQEESVRVQLTAESSYGKDVQMYVRNPQDDTWELLDVSRDGSVLTALCPVSGYTDKQGEEQTVRVLVQARTTAYTPYTAEDTFQTEKGDNAGWDGKSTENNPYAAPENYDFAIAWYTDTQYYSERYNWHYQNMVDWIIKNEDALDIDYVVHTGDIVDEFNEEYQWAYARSQQERLEQAGIPSGVLGGNHDVGHGNMYYDLYWKYFGEDYYKDNPWYGGSYQNNLGHYDIVEVDGEELLMIYISWDVYEPETDWINSVLAAHPDTKAIIATHCGINAAAQQSYTSNILLENVCRNNPNVLAIINGHYHGSSLNFVELTSDTGETHTVYQICTDYQSAPEGGEGYIKMLYFDLANDKIYINSYSPSLNDVNYYDEQELLDYTGGAYQNYDIDVVALPVEFDRETEKTLTVSDISVAGLYGEALASSNMTEDGARIPLDGLSAGDAVYGVLADASGKTVGYTTVAQLEAEADYSKVDEAISRIPDDLSVYTDESVQALQDALAAVVRGKKASEQAAVDKMAADIEAAIAGLQRKDGADVDAPDTGDMNTVLFLLTLSLAAGAGALGAVRLYQNRKSRRA